MTRVGTAISFSAFGKPPGLIVNMVPEGPGANVGDFWLLSPVMPKGVWCLFFNGKTYILYWSMFGGVHAFLSELDLRL